MSTIGVIGAGQIGSTVARAALARGHGVVISNSRGASTLEGVVGILGPRARAGTVFEAAEAGDLVLIATPVRAHPDLPARAFAGKIVLDATNYYPARDGEVPSLLDGSTTSSERLQALLPDARVVKAFNVINAAEIESTAAAAGDPGRCALPVAGDDPDARAAVSRFLDELGFDVVDVGPLAEGWRIGPGTPGYIVHSTADELRTRTASAARSRQPTADGRTRSWSICGRTRPSRPCISTSPSCSPGTPAASTAATGIC